jgi:hypothetical protein
MAIESGTGDSYMGLGSGYEAFHIDLSTGESWRLNGQNFFVNFGYSDYDNTRMELTLMYSAYGYESDVETVTLGKGLVIVDIYRDFSYGSFTFSPSLGFFIGLESFEATGASVVSYDGFSAGGGVGASMMYKFNEHHSIDTKLQLNANQSYGDDVDIIHGFGYGATLGYKYWF